MSSSRFLYLVDLEGNQRGRELARPTFQTWTWLMLKVTGNALLSKFQRALCISQAIPGAHQNFGLLHLAPRKTGPWLHGQSIVGSVKAMRQRLLGVGLLAEISSNMSVKRDCGKSELCQPA